MQLLLKKRSPDQIEFGIIYGGIALVILGAGWLRSVLSYAPDCVFKGLTGIPCPTCGVYAVGGAFVPWRYPVCLYHESPDDPVPDVGGAVFYLWSYKRCISSPPHQLPFHR